MTHPYCSRCQRAMYLAPGERSCGDCLAYEDGVRAFEAEQRELAEAEGSAAPTDHGGQARARGSVKESAEAASLHRRLAWREHQMRELRDGVDRALATDPPEGWEPEGS